MASIQFTPADRGPDGKIRMPEPRSLADLLPKPSEICQDAKRQPWTRQEIAALSIVTLCALFVLAYAWATPNVTTAPQARQTAAPTVRPTEAPITPTAPPVRFLVAFAAPDGVLLGAVESTRAMTPTAHYGDGWIQANVQGSGLIWLRATDSPELAIVGPDLAPRAPAAAPVYVPAAPPAAPQCAEAGIPGKMVKVCGDGDLEARVKAEWLAQYGGNIGEVTSK